MPAERVWELLSPFVAPPGATLWRSATYRFHAVIARNWRKGNVFLAGDAAHQQPPFLGQGMCQGIRDAVNLTWKLDLVLRKLAPDALLDTYEAERKNHVEQLIGVVKTLGRFVCERDEEKARERDQKLIDEMGGKVVTTWRQDIIPPLSKGLISNDKVSGALFPQPRSSDGQLLDDAIGLGFRLVLSPDVGAGFSLDDISIPDLKVVRIKAQNDDADGNICSEFVEAEGVVTAWLAKHGAIAALVRPDNYVFGVASTEADIARIASELERMLASDGSRLAA